MFGWRTISCTFPCCWECGPTLKTARSTNATPGAICWPTWLATSLAAGFAWTVGLLAAVYETVLLIGPLPLAGMVVGWAAWVVYLAFAVAVAALAAGVVRSTVAVTAVTAAGEDLLVAEQDGVGDDIAEVRRPRQPTEDPGVFQALGHQLVHLGLHRVPVAFVTLGQALRQEAALGAGGHETGQPAAGQRVQTPGRI